MPNCDNVSSSNQQTKPIGGYKEVVIIGNGPSGLCLSYFLSGHWPYWNKNKVSDEYLQMRLEYCDNGLSLVEQDLEYLADGLEGRSLNPVALLYDKLKHPDGDLGLDLPTCLTWNYDPLKEVDHICIGKAPGPGGAWNDIEGSQLTISPSRWMELPDMSYVDWKRQTKMMPSINAGLVFSSKNSNFSEDNSLLNGTSTRIIPRRLSSQLPTEESRVSMHDVKNYYQDYARQKNLDKYLLNNATVVGVRRVYCSNKLLNGSAGGGCSGGSGGSGATQAFWEVSGLIDNRRDRKKASSLTHKGDLMEFRFWCRHLVLANGCSDLPNELNVKGESSRFVLRSIRELEEKIKDDLQRLHKDPLLIVGSGLSAADAILLAQKYHIRIVHVIRKPVNDPNLVFNKLPKKIYPEYHRVYEQMVRNRYVNFTAATTTSNVTDASAPETSSGGLNTNHHTNYPSTVELNHNNDTSSTTTTTTLPQDKSYILYDDHYVKHFTSKRTCVLSSFQTTQGSGQKAHHHHHQKSHHLNRHLHIQKTHHLNHQRQLKEFDEDGDQENNNNNNDKAQHLLPVKNVNNLNDSFELKISYACVLIGYSPDLDFLPFNVANDLAVDATKPLDTKDNPILINQYTHETVKCANLYAMGPLIGDNFVRFGTGGALAIASSVWKKKQLQQQQQQQNVSSSLAHICFNENNNNNKNGCCDNNITCLAE